MTPSDAIQTLFEITPTAAISRAFGVLADLELPAPVQAVVNRRFAALAGIDLSESEHPPEAYPSLNAFFTRRLRDGVRPVADVANGMVCPVDGRLSEFGAIHEGMLVQAKGREYTLAELLHRDRDLARGEDGS